METDCEVLLHSSYGSAVNEPKNGSFLSTGKTWTFWSGSRGMPQKWSEGWNISPVRKGWES